MTVRRRAVWPGNDRQSWRQKKERCRRHCLRQRSCCWQDTLENCPTAAGRRPCRTIFQIVTARMSSETSADYNPPSNGQTASAPQSCPVTGKNRGWGGTRGFRSVSPSPSAVHRPRCATKASANDTTDPPARRIRNYVQARTADEEEGAESRPAYPAETRLHSSMSYTRPSYRSAIEKHRS